MWQIFTGCGDGRRAHDFLLFVCWGWFPCRTASTVSTMSPVSTGGVDAHTLHYITYPCHGKTNTNAHRSVLPCFVIVAHASSHFPFPFAPPSCPAQSVCADCVPGWSGNPCATAQGAKGNKPSLWPKSKHMAVLRLPFFLLAVRKWSNLSSPTHPSILSYPTQTFLFLFLPHIPNKGQHPFGSFGRAPTSLLPVL